MTMKDTETKGNIDWNKHYSLNPLEISYRTFPPRSLDDVTIRTDFPVPIDRGIERLVKAINIYGIETHGSCGGHTKSDPKHKESLPWQLHKYPWITLAYSQPGYEELALGLKEIVNSFNLSSRIKWKLDVKGAVIRTVGIARTARKLKKMQESADALADRIFNESPMFKNNGLLRK